MNIKSLLIGSAAALVAVSGARAADAVIAEPEPVEYVRVCDAYGAGFFYIPGTETCLQISGYIYMDVGGQNHSGFPSDMWGFAPDGATLIDIRSRINFDARTNTEWGTLRSYIRLQADQYNYGSEGPDFVFQDRPGDQGVGIDQAIIELGGLRMGYTESAWLETQGATVDYNYGTNTNEGLGSYGYQQRQLIAYTFGLNSPFRATISLEDDAEGDNWVPDVVGHIAYTQGWGGVWATVGYDEDRFDTDESGWGAQVGAQFNLPNMAGSNIRVIGFYADSDNDYGARLSYGAGPAPEWSILASYTQAFTQTLSGTIGAQYFNDFYEFGSDDSTGIDGWGINAQLTWTPVTGFSIEPEISYLTVDDDAGLDDDDVVAARVRFRRTF